jgi:hypothetical protein
MKTDAVCQSCYTTKVSERCQFGFGNPKRMEAKCIPACFFIMLFSISEVSKWWFEEKPQHKVSFFQFCEVSK